MREIDAAQQEEQRKKLEAARLKALRAIRGTVAPTGGG